MAYVHLLWQRLYLDMYYISWKKKKNHPNEILDHVHLWPRAHKLPQTHIYKHRFRDHQTMFKFLLTIWSCFTEFSSIKHAVTAWIICSLWFQNRAKIAESVLAAALRLTVLRFPPEKYYFVCLMSRSRTPDSLLCFPFGKNNVKINGTWFHPRTIFEDNHEIVIHLFCLRVSLNKVGIRGGRGGGSRGRRRGGKISVKFPWSSLLIFFSICVFVYAHWNG